MITDEIRDELFRLQNPKCKALLMKTIPTLAPETVIGVYTPELRKLAGQLVRKEDIGQFLNALPHMYFEENQLHAFIISAMKGFPECLSALTGFLPYVDNWATCDQMSPKVFKKHRPELQESIRTWISSGETYTIRFGIGMLMEHFLDEDFDLVYPEMVASVRSDEYYVNMMVAWYFATALAKQYEAALPYITGRRLEPWTHNKTIRKSIESYRIPPDHKAYLKAQKIVKTRQ